jgi:hypothetical protein
MGYLQVYKQLMSHVGFDVFTAVVMKSIVFWDITPCSPLSVNRRFGGTYSLLLPCWFLFELISSTLKMEAMFLRHVG